MEQSDQTSHELHLSFDSAQIEQPEQTPHELHLSFGPAQMEQPEQPPHELHFSFGPVQVEEFLSVREAAKIMGVSTRSVYGYIETGKLLGIRIGASIAVHAEAVRNYQRPVVGRPRTRTPIWRVPVVMNLQYLTTINVRARDGQGVMLEPRLAEIRAGSKHLIPGTVARYIVRDKVDPDALQIILVWRKLVMPPNEEREAAIAALCADLSDILDLDTMSYREGQVVMNA
jgi:excisionase family DNA binding protein